MLLTICTIRQLPRALALGHSFSQFWAALDWTAQDGANLDWATQASDAVLIGLVDDPTHLPADFASPFPLLPITDLLPADQLQTLSSAYTPTEFAAACKPLFIAEAFRRYPGAGHIIYADPSIQFFAPIAQLIESAPDANIVLTPFVTQSPASGPLPGRSWPDEKYFQNIGLYTADFLLFRRSAETDRMLAWWDDRVRERAYNNPCVGLCLDQIWLMHVPIFFQNVVVMQNPGWHVGLWNLPERTLRAEGDSWFIDGPKGQRQPLRFINFKGIWNSDEGFFPRQNRVVPARRPDIMALLQANRQAVASYQSLTIDSIKPAYGQQPEPVVLRGWRHTTVQSLRAINRFIDRVYLPVIK